MIMRRMKSKKSEMDFEQIWMIGQGLILVFILVAGMIAVRDSFNSMTLEKNYLVRDFSMLLSITMSLPGNMFFFYPLDLSKYEFDYDIGDGYAKMKSIDGPEWTSYHYGIDNNTNVVPLRSTKVSAIFFTKDGNEVRISKNSSKIGKTLICPKIDTQDKMWQSKGIYINFSSDIGGSTFLRLQSKSLAFSQTYDADLHKTALVFRTNEEKNMEKGIKVYVNGDSENKDALLKMGCLMANQLSDKFNPIYSTVILADPNDPDLMMDARKTLHMKGDVLFVYLGKGLVTSNTEDSGKLSDAIMGGLNDHYSYTDDELRTR